MRDTSVWAEKLEGLSKEFKIEFDNHRKRLSAIDIQLQDVLHELENVKFNVVEGYYYSKRIQDLRLERRSIKTDFEQIQRIKEYLFNNIDSRIERYKKSMHKIPRHLIFIHMQYGQKIGRQLINLEAYLGGLQGNRSK